MTVEETLNTYVAANNAPDGAERRRLLTACFAPDGVQTGAKVNSTGVEAIAKNIEGFRATNPGARFTLSKDYQSSAMHSVVWASIRVAFPDGRTSIMTHIMDLNDDNRIQRLVNFWGAPPSDFD